VWKFASFSRSEADSSIAQAAAELGLDRTNLHKRIKAMGLGGE
jgi:transcriptional regulator of acetoin/glycerol metabolism